MEITMDKAIQKEMERDIYKTKKYLKNNSVVIDVGANIGYFSLFVLRNFENLKVVAIEPHPRNFEMMKNVSD
jgi:tRNA1(Val) A37 N6-methylase TrmN6